MNNVGGLYSFCGVKFIENEMIPESEPVLQLSDNVMVSDEFRARCDDFYLKLFGDRPVFYMVGGCIVAHPSNIGYFKAQLDGVIK